MGKVIENNNKNLIKNVSFGVFQRILIYIYFAMAFIEPYTIGAIGPVSRYYILFLVGVLLITNREIKIRKYQFYFLSWFIYKFITLIWTPDYTIFQGHLFTHLGMMLLFLTLTFYDFEKRTIVGILNTVWISSGIMGLLSLFFNQTYSGDRQGRIVLFLFGQELDPNNQAALLLIGISVSLYFLINNKNKLLSLLILFINLYSILLTGSRGGFIGFALMIILTIIINLKKNSLKKNFKIIFFGGLFFILMILIVNNFLPVNIFDRIFVFSSYEGGSGRSNIWKNAFELFTQNLNPLFGAGWGSYWGYNNYYNAVHNEYLAMLVNVGLLGFLLFFGPIIVIAYRNIKRSEYVSILILLSGLLPSLFLDSINKRYFWNPIIILFVIYNFLNKQEISDNYFIESPKISERNY